MKKVLFPLMFILLFAGCSKKETVLQPPPVDDARKVLLKTVLEQGLPLQYRFVYNAEQYVTEMNYADGFSIYTVEYENKRVKKLTNTWSHSYLLYNYNNGGLLTRLDEFDSTDNKLQDYQLLYNASGNLTEVTRKDYTNDPTGIIYKKEKLAYHADGNLASLEQYFLLNGTLDLVQTKQYSDYDNETNVDDFYILHGFQETFLFLPQVKLQLNNPRKEVKITKNNTFEITYTYEFANHLPVKKMGEMKQTRGGGTGQVFHFTNQFSYY